MKQSWKGPVSRSKHTVPGVGGWPAAGWGVASQPAIWLPQVRYPGATLGMRSPAAPSKRYHEASSSVVAPATRCGDCASQTNGTAGSWGTPTLRQASLRVMGAYIDCGQPAWQYSVGRDAVPNGGRRSCPSQQCSPSRCQQTLSPSRPRRRCEGAAGRAAVMTAAKREAPAKEAEWTATETQAVLRAGHTGPCSRPCTRRAQSCRRNGTRPRRSSLSSRLYT
eukprot:scaffold44165_cov57-Phaeocystis_antarctica.AAC.4